MVGRPEVTITAEIAEVGSPSYVPRRIETPSERAVKDPIAWDERIRAEPRVPIPSGAVPHVRRPAASRRVPARRIDVRFRKIRGPQTGPTVEIILVFTLVEFLRLQLAGCG